MKGHAQPEEIPPGRTALVSMFPLHMDEPNFTSRPENPGTARTHPGDRPEPPAKARSTTAAEPSRTDRPSVSA